jgi:DNA-directed RNA polymerase, mitochondrial
MKTRDDAPEERKRAQERFERRDAAVARAHGRSATALSRTIIRDWLPTLANGLARSFGRDASIRFPLSLIEQIKDRKVIAACILDGALQSIGTKDSYVKAVRTIGTNLNLECARQDLLSRYPDEVRKDVKRSSQQSRSARHVLSQGMYKTKQWPPEGLVQVGNWGVGRLMELLPNVFMTGERSSKKFKPEKVLLLTPEAQAEAEDNIARMILRNPVWLPTTNAPAKWTDWDKGGTADDRLSGALTIIGRNNKQTALAVSAAVADGSMRPVLDALSALQAVPWHINKRVMEVVSECDDKGIVIADQDGASRAVFGMDMRTAKETAELDRFWTPMHLDWRGRVYSAPHFNFQRDDRIRALFRFADGEPIGARGLYWLKVHVANCGDFNKVSKKSFDERVKWTDAHGSRIKNCADDPLDDLWWTEADKPFQFLAASIELTAALEEGPKFVSGLPISFDGSCSGYQHLSAMTRDEETARLVNLTHESAPKDIYEAVAERVEALVTDDLKGPDAGFAQAWLDHGIDRAVVKSPVMTYVYGSTRGGMADQIRSVLKARALKGNAFAGASDYAAAPYLTRHIRSALGTLISRPEAAMTFLKKMAMVAAANGRFLQWTTPTGLPWKNIYYETEQKQVRLALQGKSFRVKVTTGDKPELDSAGIRDGVVPNFVHACDAAHLMRTVNAAVSEGITSIATVHDSFGCLPSRAERFRKIILEQFTRMYSEHDVLAEIREQACKDLEGQARKLPPLPARGSFDLNEVLNADFAFA